VQIVYLWGHPKAKETEFSDVGLAGFPVMRSADSFDAQAAISKT
jgi:hypothetical protein